MSPIFFIFSILIASTLAITNPTEDELSFKASFEEALEKQGITPRMLEAQIISKVEGIIAQVPTSINYTNINITTVNETIVANGFLENLTIKGIENHVIDGVKFGILPIGFKMHLGFDDVLVEGYYDVIALLSKLIPIYGNGQFSAGARGVSATVSVDMTSMGGFLSVTKFDFGFIVEGVTFRFDNLLGGPLGDVATEMIEENLPSYIERILYYHGDAIEASLTSSVNAFLSDKTVNDLIDWINGKTTLAPPITTVPSIVA